jgi:hypothetical protein
VKFGSWKIVIVCALILSATVSVCQADTVYNFSIFNSSKWANDNHLNFIVSVCDEGQNKVSFLFENLSSASSSITDIYFDSGSILGSGSSISNSKGVSFSGGASPATLPGGENLTPAFARTPSFAADSNPPPPKNGINPEEWLKITFNLNTGESFDNVINQLGAGVFRIGIHVQSLPDGSSVSAINAVHTPELATIALMTLGSIAFSRRIKR